MFGIARTIRRERARMRFWSLSVTESSEFTFHAPASSTSSCRNRRPFSRVRWGAATRRCCSRSRIAAAYYLAFFARISPPAYGFAALSAAGSVVFIWQGVIKRRLTFKWASNLKSIAGTALIVFALTVYPVWSIYAGHPYPEMPTFGLPCTTTIFTIGLLCFAVQPSPRSTLVVPLLWCLVGAQAAFLFGVWSDLGLIAAAAVGIWLLLTAGRRSRRAFP
jgi:hypothetical protein